MKRTLVALTACALAAASPGLAQDAETQTNEQGTASASFIGTDGEELGQAQLWGAPNGTLIEITLEGLPAEQWVAFHIHENGTCDPEEAFESAGGHFNPADVDHGYISETGPHAGDMPNQYVGADGVLNAQVFNPFVRVLSDGGDADIVGLALMIHDGTDDYQSQPSGDAGDRIACAVIE